MAKIDNKTKKSPTWMRIIKWGAIVIFSLLLLIIVAAIAIPYFFRDELVELAKKEINNNIKAEADFSDVSLSLFKNFPELTFSLKDLTIDGIDQFEGVRLADIKSLDLSMDVMSVVNKDEGPIAIHSIGLTDPKIHVIVLRNGTANYDIAYTSDNVETPSEPSQFEMSLSEYSIENGDIIYDDRQGGTYLKIRDLDHVGKGDFTESIYDIATKTNIAGLTFGSGGMSYLSNARVKADVTLNADMNQSKFTLKDNSISVNAMKLDMDGWVKPNGENVDMDLNFAAPSTEFKHLLSMIPGAYTKEFEDVKADGKFKLKGDVKGTYNANRFPAFNLDLDVADGSFQYPDLPMGMKDIQTRIKVVNSSSDLDRMAIDIPRFHTLLGTNPFDAKLKLRTPISDPDVDMEVKGTVNLEDLAKAFPMEGVSTLKGTIISDIVAKTKMSYIDNRQYDKVDMQGNLQLENMDYQGKGMPHVLVQKAQMDFTPKNVKLNDFVAKMGKSDIRANGTLDNILAYFSPEKTMTGQLQIRSNYFDANEWISNTETSTETTPTTSPTSGNTEVFDRFKFVLDAEMDKIDYEEYELRNARAKGSFTPDEIEFSQLGAKMGRSDIAMNGKLNNIFGFLFDNEVVGGVINLKSNYLDLNELTGYDPNAARTSSATNDAEATSTEMILVPDFLDVKVNADVDKVLYTNLALDNVRGAVGVKNERVDLSNVSADLLGGRAKLTGNYDTSDKKKPTFEFGYDISKFDFQKSFNAFNTFQAAAPIGEFIKGVFNSNLSLKGVMGKDMMPDLNTITADGDFLTLDAIIQNFIPMKEIANTLNVKYLNDDIRLKNTKNFFKIQDGKVLIQEFPFTYKDIKMRVGGAHGFDQNIDYDMKLDIPIQQIGKGKVSGYAQSGMDYLGGFASKAGINLGNLNLGEMVEVTLKLTGPMMKPKVKVTNVRMSTAQGSSVKDALVDQVKDMANDKLNEVKNQAQQQVNVVVDKAEDKVNEVVDQVTDKAEEKVDEVIEQVTDKAEDKVQDVVKDQMGGLKDQAGDKLDDVLDGQGEAVKDKAKDVLDNFNPFKKKKKKNKDNN